VRNSGLPPATLLRLLCLGDNWVYRVAGTLTPPGAEPRELIGQITVSIVRDRLLGRPDWMTILFSQQFEIAHADGSKQPKPSPDWMFSFVQSASDRNLCIVADNMTPDGVPRIAKTPQVFYPGTWSLQTAYNNRLDFDNGDQVNNVLKVFDYEQIETEAGSFPSWVARISSESPATGLIEGKDWWTPDLGAPVKFWTSSRMPDGSQMRFVATLKTSSVR
jgi:hypothetical protein